MKPAKIDVAVLFIFFTRTEKTAAVFEQIRKARPTRLYLYQDGTSLRGLFNIISNHSQTLTVTAFNVVTLVSLGRCIIKH